MLVVVLLLYGNNNNGNHNNILRINRDEVTLGKSGKFKDCVLSWMVGKKRLQVQCTNFGIGVLCFFRAHVPGCVNGQYFWCIGAAFLREFDVQIARCGPSEF